MNTLTVQYDRIYLVILGERSQFTSILAHLITDAHILKPDNWLFYRFLLLLLLPNDKMWEITKYVQSNVKCSNNVERMLCERYGFDSLTVAVFLCVMLFCIWTRCAVPVRLSDDCVTYVKIVVVLKWRENTTRR